MSYTSILNTATKAVQKVADTAVSTANTGLNTIQNKVTDAHSAVTGALDKTQRTMNNAAHNATAAAVGPKETPVSKPVDEKARKQESMQIAKAPQLPASERMSLLKIKDISDKLNEIKRAASEKASKILAKKVAHHATKSLQYHSKEQEAMGDPEKQSEKNKARALRFANQLLAGAAMQALMTQVGQTEAENMVSLALDNQMIEEAKLANQGGKRKRKHKRKTMKRKSNKRKHKKRHQTKKRKHKKRHQTKKRKLKKKAHKKKAHKKKHRRTRKQRGGKPCPCGV